MKPASFFSDRLYLADPADTRIPRYPTARDRIVAAFTNPELLAILIICSVGLLATAILSVVVPSFAESFTLLQQFL
jgi:hypothetical protein